MSLGSTHRQSFFDLIKMIVDWLFRGSMPMDCLIIAFFYSSGMPAKRIASRLACKSISSSILTLYEIELFQFMRESALVAISLF